jgi:serine/threonine protein kinase
VRVSTNTRHNLPARPTSAPLVANEQSTVGPWLLGERLGRGGNATVWKATREGWEVPVALKVISATKPQRESYRRFVQEIEFLRGLPDEDGVLPLLDAHLPDRPTAADRPWLAMPIAVPIRDALAGESLEVVVAALAEIAGTLARLAERGVAHRDLKPGNLYELEGRWIVGDFGLVAAPDVDELTRTGQVIGPAHFTAYELIRDPTGSDQLPADVYSLAKTLWVLAAGQEWPPEGHQVAGTRLYSLAELRPHPNAVVLDRLIDRGTRLHPEERPTMAEFATDLRAWQELKGPSAPLDVSELGARFRAKLERQLAAEDLLQQRKDLAHATARRLQELVRPLNDALAAVHPRPEVNRMPDKYGRNMLSTYRSSGAPDIEFNFGRISKIVAGEPHFPFELVFGSGIELAGDGDIIFRAYIHVGHAGVLGSAFTWEREPETAPVGSVEADRLLESGISDLQAKLREGLEVFVAEAPVED